MAIDRRLLFNIDWGFLAAALILMGIGVATILSATFAGRNTGLGDEAALRDRAGPGRHAGRGLARLPAAGGPLARALPGRGRECSSYVLVFGPRIAGTRRWILGPGGIPVPAQRVRQARGRPAHGQALRGGEEGDARPDRPRRAGGRGRPHGPAHRRRARPRHRLHARPALPDRGLPGRPAHARGPRRVPGDDGGRQPGLDVRAEGLPEVAHLHLPRPQPRPAGRRLPEDPVRDRGGIGRGGGEGATSRARRASSGTFPRATPTSSSRCWRRRTGSWAW